jgi:nucleotide-binding universal stress UspA family protein
MESGEDHSEEAALLPMPGQWSVPRLTSMDNSTISDRPEATRAAVPPAVFADIVCGVDGSRGSYLAAHQAVALSGVDGAVRFVAVHHTEGVGVNELSTLSELRAAEALEVAKRLAASQGVQGSGTLISGARPSEILRSEAVGHDLLVIGSHGGSRAGGIIPGGVVTQIAHRCERPLLIARRAVDHDGFPESVLLATDGSPGSWAAAKVVARMGARRQVGVHVVHVSDRGDRDRDAHWQVRQQLIMITAESGTPPGFQDKPGAVPERICQVARASQSSLIVIGRRGLSGLEALGSVSERVAHRASCSVLLVPVEEPTR